MEKSKSGGIAVIAKKDPKELPKLQFLLRIEAEMQEIWEREKIFENNAPEEGDGKEAYLATVPYPYMNGRLHLGHAFTISKAEMAVSYRRVCGESVLFPFGFHCTGMPIVASADKLKRELEEFGTPPVFPVDDDKIAAEKAQKLAEAKKEMDPTVHKSKKSKAVAKGAVRTWTILQSVDVPDDEIPRFVDPMYWLEYFPSKCMDDLKRMGCGIDWRRSFITTDVNRFYDAFAKWQFNELKKQNRVVFDKKLVVYSPKDGQPCADHDRSSGEGIGPQEYTLIKMKLMKPYPKSIETALADERGRNVTDVFLLAATLRPETMYGQTNCFVLPDGDYGMFSFGKEATEAYVCVERAVLNMSYQGMSETNGQYETLAPDVSGTELVGARLQAPYSAREFVFVLPMFSISLDKGTGVVTSVPSDSADDYMALQDLARKPALRERFGLNADEVLPTLEPIPIIQIPGYGPCAAKDVCEQLKIGSQNDSAKLAEAKEILYTKGFYQGVMTAGKFAGTSVQEAKNSVRDALLAEGLALKYAEPAGPVMSRSGDTCVVALADQWFLRYGDEDWKEAVRKVVEHMETFHESTMVDLKNSVGNLHDWACSRSYGLGTHLPFDERYLIDSLSDSTIYMAYYAVAHLLHEASLDGSGSDVATPSDDDFNYMFRRGPEPADSRLPAELLKRARREFEYWYPVDLRVSGRELINNHLTFYVYNHVALLAAEHAPRAVRTNGHLLMNGRKMAKSEGNFRTLADAIDHYSADGMRLVLANSGDSVSDANFDEKECDSIILELYELYHFIESTVKQLASLPQDASPDAFADAVFTAQINKAVLDTKQAFEALHLHSAVQLGYRALSNACGAYRTAVGEQHVAAALMRRWIDVMIVVVTPICPHICDKLWRSVLGREGTALRAGWPSADAPDAVALLKNKVLGDAEALFRQKLELALRKAKKGAPAPNALRIFISNEWPQWHHQITDLLRAHSDDASVMKMVMQLDAVKALPKSRVKLAQAVAAQLLRRVKDGEDKDVVFNSSTEFDSVAFFHDRKDYIAARLKLSHVEVQSDVDYAHNTNPFTPALEFFVV